MRWTGAGRQKVLKSEAVGADGEGNAVETDPTLPAADDRTARTTEGDTMFATAWKTARRKGVAAGLAVAVATAGIGVAVAAPSDAPASPEAASAFAIGATEDVGETVEDPSPPQTQEIDVPAVQPVVEPPAVTEEESAPSTASSAGASGVADSPPVDVRQFLPEGEGFDRDRLEELLAGAVADDDLAEGAGIVADEVIARIQACVGDVAGEFASGFDPGASAGAGQSFASSVVDDVLPCVAGLVEDALGCVAGLVEEIMSTVMGMDFDEIAGLAGVIVDELVDCVSGASSD